MAFYRPDPAMASYLESVLDQLDAEGRPGLRNSLSLTWVRYRDVSPEAGQGTAQPGMRIAAFTPPAL